MNSLVDVQCNGHKPAGWQARLAGQLSAESLFRLNEPLAKKTTLRVGGPADFYVEPCSDEDVQAVLRFCRAEDLPWFVLGRGSNLLIRDGGVRGVVIHVSHPHFSGIRVEGRSLDCGAGARLKSVAVQARQHDLAGLEFLEGIPGSVGGALRMNAGAMGSAIFERVETVRFLDPDFDVRTMTPAQLKPEYRGCAALKDAIVLAARLVGTAGEAAEIQRKMDTFSRKRWESQPAAPSAGCVFKNTPTVPAGRLIEELGLKGTRIGGAMISMEHGNFFVNTGNATAQDFLSLIDLVREKAAKQRAIHLETEVQIIGEK